jgi:hypothetical protein
MADETDKPDDHQHDVDPALVEILQGHHDIPTRLRLLEAYRQERYERQMRRCQAGWAATRDPGFIVEAQVLIDFDQRLPPPWLSEAIYDFVTETRAETKGYAARALNALIRRRRFEAVRDAKSAGMTWNMAYAEAAAALVETPARGSADSMKAAYMEVLRDIREGRSDQYITPHPERGEVLKRRGEILRRNPTG